jgi:hypothetical protein
MKRIVVLGLLVVVTAVSIFADTAYKDACRRILYAVKPVEAIKAVDNDTLTRLSRYALGIPSASAGQEALNDSDSYLFSWLANTESARRGKSPDEFSLYLQERKEANQPYYRQGDSDAIKIDTWISLFQLDLMFSN